ncbi:MAG TPA: potassium channel protein [Dehalococcoidales bacterium]|nr:potassium channel protein [Dehalococcoidales bacterium]
MNTRPYSKFIWSGVGLICILVIGTTGYWLLTDRQYSLIDTLYMTVITVTTIGFSEVVDLTLNPAGRIFTMFIALAGIGVVGYAATNLTVLLVEGQLTNSFKRRHMENIARTLKGHYIVCGAGTAGQHIIAELVSTKRPFIVIDSEPGKLEKISSLHKNLIHIEGNATDNATLIKAGISQAIGLFAVSGDDNLNLVIALTARHLNSQIRVVAECLDITNGEKMKKVGADSFVSPGYIGGLRMASEMIRPTVVSFLDVMLRDTSKNLRVEEIAIPGHFIQQKLADTGMKNFSHSLLLAIKTPGDWIYNPPDSYEIKTGDVLIFMTTPEGREEMEEKLRKP